MSLSKAQLKRLQNGSSVDRRVYNLMQNTDKVMGTILLGNLFVNTMLTALTAEIIARHIDSPLWSSLISIAVVTPTLILFGELTPKVNGLHYNLGVARFCATPILLLSYLLAPFLLILKCATPLIRKLQGTDASESSWGMLTNAELVATFDAAESTGASTTREHALLERVLTFGTIEAKEIMVPRPNIIGIDDSLTLKEAFTIAQQKQFSHFPVYHNSIDEIWGVLVFTDILRYAGTPMAQTPLASFRKDLEHPGETKGLLPVLPVEFIPGTARIERVLADLRKKSQSMAVVVTEYGGTLGMVTRSMILEEIVGRYAFSGRDTNRLQKHHDGFLADGRARLRLVEEALGFDFSDTNTETLAGYVMERLGKIPAAGDSFQENGYRFQVVRTVGKLAAAVTITPVNQEEEAK